MLVLNRKSQEVVMIGDDIKVIVLDINHLQVKLGFKRLVILMHIEMKSICVTRQMNESQCIKKVLTTIV